MSTEHNLTDHAPGTDRGRIGRVRPCCVTASRERQVRPALPHTSPRLRPVPQILARLRATVSRPANAQALRTIGWVVAVVSIAITLNRAVDIAITTYPVDFAVYLLGATHVFGGHLYTTYLPYPKKSFTYPPVAALLFLPFAAVTRVTAQVVWAVLSTLLLVGLLERSLTAARPDWRRSDTILWSLVLSFPRSCWIRWPRRSASGRSTFSWRSWCSPISPASARCWAARSLVVS